MLHQHTGLEELFLHAGRVWSDYQQTFALGHFAGDVDEAFIAQLVEDYLTKNPPSGGTVFRPDNETLLLENGVLLSFLIIFLSNIVALLLLLRCFGVISLRGYLQDLQNCAREIVVTYAELATWICQQF